jgi:hypothetical protein
VLLLDKGLGLADKVGRRKEFSDLIRLDDQDLMLVGN